MNSEGWNITVYEGFYRSGDYAESQSYRMMIFLWNILFAYLLARTAAAKDKSSPGILESIHTGKGILRKFGNPTKIWEFYASLFS